MKKKFNFLFALFVSSTILISKSQLQPIDIIFSSIGINPAIAEENHTFYVDPELGSMSNPGTIDQPWSTLENVIQSNLIETKDKNGNIVNPGGVIKAGDTIILRSGYHGHVQIKNAFNDQKITIKSDTNAEAKLSELELISVKNWSFSGLIISPSVSDTAIRTDTIVVLGDNGFLGNSSNIDLIDSYIYSFSENAEDLSATDWQSKAKNGVLLGRNATNLNVQNNFISKTKFGINAMAPDSIVSGNVVTDFSADGIRAVASRNIIEFNVIKNNYVIDGNHPDGIQGFSATSSVLSDVSVVGNVILNRDKKGNQYSGGLQGLGFFDGPFSNISMQDNVVMAFTYQGLALYDSIGGTIKHNVAYTPSNIETLMTARITLGTKNKSAVMSNYVAYNLAHQYVFYKRDSQKTITNIQNLVMDQNSGSTFMDRLNANLNTIYTKYGQTHITAKQNRVNQDFISFGPSILSN